MPTGAKSSPVPLIIFIVLFVFSTVGLVLVAMELAAARHQMNEGFDPSAHGAARFDTMPGLKRELVKLTADKTELGIRIEKYKKVIGSGEEIDKLEGELRDRLRADVEQIAEGKGPPLLTYIVNLKSEYAKFQAQHQRSMAENATRIKNLQAEIEKAQTQVREKQALVDERDRTIENLNLKKDQEVKALRDEAEALRAQLTKIGEELNNVKSDRDEGFRRRDLIIAKQNEELREIRREKVTGTTGGQGTPYDPDREAPDGKVILVDRNTGIIVDIGRKAGVRPGLRFQLYGVQADGSRIKRGDIEIRAVQPEISRAVLLGGGNPIDVVQNGDILVNPAFHPGRVKIFVADDGFTEVQLQNFRDLLANYGSVLEKEVSVRTDYVIIKPGQQGRVSEKARDWGIPMIPADDLTAMLGR